MFGGGWVVSELRALYELRSASFTRAEKCFSHIIIVEDCARHDKDANNICGAVLVLDSEGC